MFGQRRRFAPVKEGDELDVKIEAVGEKGDGIAKKQGFVLFVPNTKEGDEVRVRVTRVLRNAGFAEVIGGSTGKIEETKPAKPKEEEEVAELEEESKEHDSEDFGEETEQPEAEEVAEKPDEEFAEGVEEEPKEEEADDSEFKDE
jgi:predicted RNA-binding protein with TRAM domain